MKTIFTLLTAVLLAAQLSACSDDDAFTLDGNGSSSGTNIPTSRNFVVLFDEPNPPVITDDGLDGGVVVQVSITAGDRLKLATVGATAYLATDWGTLSATSCQIGLDGTCTITWTSSASFDQPFFPADEAVAFTAWILGEETFIDIDGNNIFNQGDLFDTASIEANPPGADLIGPYLDLDHNRVYTLDVDDILIPGNTNGQITAVDSLYNGLNCTHPTLCSPTTQIYISDHALLPIREDGAIIVLAVTINAPADNTNTASGSNVTFTATATDPEDGIIVGSNNPVTGDNIVWSSNLDGVTPFMTNSNSVTTSTLSVGTHIITVTVTDSDGNTASANITITIT